MPKRVHDPWFIEIINFHCKQDKLNKIEDNAQQSRLDTQAAETNQNQLEKNKMYLASACDDKKIKVWDLDTFQCLKTLKGHDRGVTSIQFLGKGLMASSSNDGKIK